MSNLYSREELVEHMKNPRNFGKIKDYSKKVDVVNTSCGDEISLYLKVEKDVIVDISFVGEACGVSKASASMLTEQLKGTKYSDLKKVTKEQVLNNFTERLTPSRVNCALLVYEGIKKIDTENRIDR